MIRTHVLRCDLPKAAADALNRASGAIYTRTLITHYRVYRKRGKRTRHWLSQFAGMRLNDYLSRDDPPLLHAHSRDAAQEGFYKACKTAKANRSLGAHYPHRRKWWRTTIWKPSGIRVQEQTILLSRAKGHPPIRVVLPSWFVPTTMRLLEVRLVTQRVPGSQIQALHLALGRRERQTTKRYTGHQHHRGGSGRDPPGGGDRWANGAGGFLSRSARQTPVHGQAAGRTGVAPEPVSQKVPPLVEVAEGQEPLSCPPAAPYPRHGAQDQSGGCGVRGRTAFWNAGDWRRARHRRCAREGQPPESEAQHLASWQAAPVSDLQGRSRRDGGRVGQRTAYESNLSWMRTTLQTEGAHLSVSRLPVSGAPRCGRGDRVPSG
jgi:hypothetical protein